MNIKKMQGIKTILTVGMIVSISVLTAFIPEKVLADIWTISSSNEDNDSSVDTKELEVKVEFTEEEKEYIKNAGAITIGNLPSRAPLSSVDEDGNVIGITEDILQEISNISGLKFDIKAISYGEKPIAALKNGEFDFVAGIVRTQNFLDDSELLVTDSFMSSNVVPIVKSGTEYDPSQNLKIAIPSTFQALDEYIKENHTNFDIVYYDNNYKCLEAVSDGEVDVTMQNEYLVNYQLQIPRYKNLEIVKAYFFSEDSAMATLSSTDTTLVSIINKSIAILSQSTVNQIIVANTASYQYKYTLGDLVYMYKVPIIIVSVLTILCMLMLIIIIIIRRKNEVKLKNNNEKLEELVCQLEEAKQSAIEAMDNAKKANKAKSTFLSRMSHEIRTPMNAIIGLISLTQRVVKDNQAAIDNLEKISFSSKTLLNIINDVLDMSAIENDKLKIGNNPFDLKSLITSVSSMYYPLCKDKNIDFDLCLSGVTEENLIGDQLRLNQILNNLMSNALKFTAEGGSIKLVVSQKKTDSNKVYMQFSVIDNGCGMNEDMKNRLFKPFEQESERTALEHGGSGLGLSITQSLVTMMLGSIQVESQEGKGSTFTVSIPFTRTEYSISDLDSERLKGISAYDVNEVQNIGQCNDSDINFFGHKVMLVDDTLFNVEVAKELLQIVGLEVEVAENGKIAVDKFENSKSGTYEAILMDVQMPVMNGYDATKAIRQSSHPEAKSIPIIAMTANAFTEDIAESFSVGMNDHLTKPIDPDVLYKTLDKYLNRIDNK